MKKLISIGIALAMLTMVVVPVGVAADNPDNDSKIPFAIVGSLFSMIADEILTVDLMEALGMGDMDWLPDVIGPIGEWISGPLAWLTELTAWTMVVVGDVLATVDPILTEVAGEAVPISMADVADIFYVVSARMYDAWGDIAGNVTGKYPATLDA